MSASGGSIWQEGNPEELFEIIEPLGKGAYGAVYKARDTRDGGLVALKIMPAEVESGSLDREVEVMNRCSSDYIVNFKGGWKMEDHIWLAMEYCGAGAVTDVMKVTKKCLTEKQLRVVVRETLFGLQYLHSQKLIHRDIKGGNILMNNRGQCKLADFGVSREASTFQKATTVIGSPYWMAPEVFKDESYNERADIWSLGITIIEMAVGRPPHHDKPPLNAIFLIPKSDPPTLSVGKWSDDCHDFLAECLKKDPAERPSASDLLKHSWITSTPKGLKPIMELVTKAMPLLDEMRMEARLDEMADQGETGDYSTVDASTGRGGDGMSSDEDDSDYASQTMIAAGKKTESSDEDGGGDYDESDDGDYGTMKFVGDKQKDSESDAEDYSGDDDGGGTMLVRKGKGEDAKDSDESDVDEDDEEVDSGSAAGGGSKKKGGTAARVIKDFPESILVNVDKPFVIPEGLSVKEYNELWAQLGQMQESDMKKLDEFYNSLLREVLAARKAAK